MAERSRAQFLDSELHDGRRGAPVRRAAGEIIPRNFHGTRHGKTADNEGVSAKMSITEQLARFAIESGPSILTPDVAASAKLKFLDTIAVMLPGARHASGMSALRVAQRMGGNATSTLF